MLSREDVMKTVRTITVHVGLGVCLAVGCLILLAAGATSADAQQQSSAVLSALSGKVEVLSKGQAAWQPARLGMQVFEGDQVRAFAGGNAELRLPDTSTVFVAENSRFAVTKLDYTPQGQRRAAFFHLAVGKIRGIVAQAAVALVQARQSNFAITTPTAVAAVRGTEVYASFDPATGKTTFLVANGTAVIRDMATGQLVTVTAPPGSPPQVVTQVQGQPLSSPAPATQAQLNQMTSTANPAPAGATTVLNAPTVTVVPADTVSVQIAPPAAVGAPPAIVVTPAPQPTTRETQVSPF